MKIYKNLLMIAAMAIAFTACSQEGDVPVLPTDEQPISFSASVPVKAFGVESRADNPTDWTLYYQLKGKNTLDSSTGKYLTVTPETKGYSFKARYAYKYKEGDEHRDLVWSVIEPNTKFYLTVVKDGVEYWAEGTKKATDNSEYVVDFKVMKPRKARFTIELTVKGNMSVDDDDFTFSFDKVKEAAVKAENVKVQAWPVKENQNEGAEYTYTDVVLAGKVYTASADFAPQKVNTLTVNYKNTFNWNVDLNKVTVATDDTESKMASEWRAGEHIILKLSVSLDELKPGNITVEGFTAEEENNFNGTVQP